MGELNIKSSTVEKGLDLAKEFLQSVMKPSLDEVGELFADKVKLWRIKNQVRNIEKVKAIVEKEGINTKAINMKVLFPYLDAVALEDDETLQDMWANLFVNYVDSEKNLTLSVYPEILRQLSSEEVEILAILYKIGTSDNLPYTDEKSMIALQAIHNLLRLGLIGTSYTIMYNENEVVKINKTKTTVKKAAMVRNYHLTDFGTDFFLACTREE